MRIVTLRFHEAENEIRAVRDAVFGEEQKVPREIDWDGRDAACLHALARSDDGEPVGTGRLSPEGKIGRLAVRHHRRGEGLGTALLEALVAAARHQGLPRVFLHAQVHALSFYEKLGFESSGEPFLEAGIEHLHMAREP